MLASYICSLGSSRNFETTKDDVVLCSVSDWLLLGFEFSRAITTNQRRYMDLYRATSSEWNFSGPPKHVLRPGEELREVRWLLRLETEPATIITHHKEKRSYLCTTGCRIARSFCNTFNNWFVCFKIL